MQNDYGKIAGFLLSVGGILCFLGIIIAESMYPGYSTSENYISDLGVGPSALVFNTSVFLLGVLLASCAYFIQKTLNFRLLSLLMVMTGIGAMGVGLFTEDAGVMHVVFSLITFVFGGVSTIVSSKLEKPPLSCLSVVLGVISLSALLLFATGNYLGLGKGGMERMIAYPPLLWAVGFGGHVFASSRD